MFYVKSFKDLWRSFRVSRELPGILENFVKFCEVLCKSFSQADQFEKAICFTYLPFVLLYKSWNTKKNVFIKQWKLLPSNITRHIENIFIYFFVLRIIFRI